MAEAETNGAGHNGGDELTAEERRALHFHHFRSVMEQKEKLDAEREEYKRLRKLAKADGLVLSDLDFMMRCAEIEDSEILTDRIRREAEIMEWFSLAKQGELFEDTDREPAEERAAREGEAAGFAGKNPQSPYGAGSKQDQRWLKGWHSAQEKMRNNLAAAMEKRNASAREDTPEQDDDESGAEIVGFPMEQAE